VKTLELARLLTSVWLRGNHIAVQGMKLYQAGYSQGKDRMPRIDRKNKCV